MSDLYIRNAEIKDAEKCFNIESECYGSYGAPYERIARRIQEYPQGFLVAELSGHIVGFINSGAFDQDDISNEALKDLEGHNPDGRNLVIFSLAVDPAFQKKGFSKKLLMRFIDNARNLRKENILLICKADLIQYYERFGFRYIKPSESAYGGYVWYEMTLGLLDFIAWGI